MYRALGNTGSERWIQAWGADGFAGWIWANPYVAASKMGCYREFAVSGWDGSKKLFGPAGARRAPTIPAFGVPPNYAGYEWYQVWTKPQLWAGQLHPEWIGWIYTKPSWDNRGSPNAHIGDFVCPEKYTLVRNSTGQIVS